MPIEITTTKTIACKNCGSVAVVKFGTYKGTQRYYCKACNRKFKADAGAFHGKIPSDYVSSATNMYYTGMSINEIRSHLKQEYGYYPSKSVVWNWVEKYTELASKQFREYHPQVGDRWIADETMLDIDGQHKVWFYDLIDEKTRFLLASRVALSRTTHDAEMLMREAYKRTSKAPKEIITDKNSSYFDGIELTFGGETEHIQSKPFVSKDSTNMIERFHGTLKDRTKVIRSFRDFETLKQFTDGWLIYYNYFKPHTALDGKMPAEEAHVKYEVKNWADLARLPITKQSELATHKTPRIIITKTKTNLDRALKLKRIRKPKEVDLGMGIVRSHGRQHLRLT